MKRVDLRKIPLRFAWDSPRGRPRPLLWKLAGGVGLLVLLFVGVFDIFKFRPHRVAPERVWAFVQKAAPEANLDPRFVYALCMAESSLDAHARTSVARGMMQLSRPAWEEVGGGWYYGAWNWKRNIRMGVAYLNWLKNFLKKEGRLSYPLLAAAYRYGPYQVQAWNFDLSKKPEVRNRIYQQILAGNPFPVAPPGEAVRGP